MAAGLGKAHRSGERPCAVSQGTPPSCGLPARGDAKGLSWVATSSKANKLESKPRNTSTSWNSASRPHSCPSLPNTCKAELIRTDSIAFVSLLGTRGGSRGGDALGSAEGPPCPACSLGRILGSRIPPQRPLCTLMVHRKLARMKMEGRLYTGRSGGTSVYSCLHYFAVFPTSFFCMCLKLALVAPSLLSCLQISVSFLPEQVLKADCSLVTKASWRARC